MNRSTTKRLTGDVAEIHEDMEIYLLEQAKKQREYRPADDRPEHLDTQRPEQYMFISDGVVVLGTMDLFPEEKRLRNRKAYKPSGVPERFKHLLEVPMRDKHHSVYRKGSTRP